MDKICEQSNVCGNDIEHHFEKVGKERLKANKGEIEFTFSSNNDCFAMDVLTQGYVEELYLMYYMNLVVNDDDWNVEEGDDSVPEEPEVSNDDLDDLEDGWHTRNYKKQWTVKGGNDIYRMRMEMEQL